MVAQAAERALALVRDLAASLRRAHFGAK